MQLQWNSLPCSYLQRKLRQVHNLEQTNQVRLPEGMPDIGRILCAWGQPVLRSKEWRSDGIVVTGGITAWVLYTPENGTEPQTVEVWLPIQAKWECPDSGREGVIRTLCQMRDIDARMLSSRKLMVRAMVGILTEVLQPAQADIYSPGSVEDDVQVLKKTYPVQLMKEAGEKLFLVQEELPISGPAPKRILSCDGQCQITEQSAVGSNAVFRGICRFHLVYMDENGRVHGQYFPIPIAQYTELDGTYDKEAGMQVMICFSNLETELLEGHVQIKCGLIAQYVISDRCLLEVAEDAYSPQRTVKPEMQMETLHTMLDRTSQMVDLTAQMALPAAEVTDVAFFPDHPTQYREEDQVVMELPGYFQTLYYDEIQNLQAQTIPWLGRIELPAGSETDLDLLVSQNRQPEGRILGDEVHVSGECRLDVLTTTRQEMPMISMLELGEMKDGDADRPALILRKLGENSLWELAKQYGSTVDAIRNANRLELEPDPDEMLLIPIV